MLPAKFNCDYSITKAVTEPQKEAKLSQNKKLHYKNTQENPKENQGKATT